MARVTLIILAFVFSHLQMSASQGPIHEAFVVQESGTLLLELIPKPAPEKIKEVPPDQDDKQAEWIPGYWAWQKGRGDFIWVSGVWRRPPPEHTWISGDWKRSDNGWMWMRGFWSRTQEDALAHIAIPPPDPLEEKAPELPTTSGYYLWVPGYWKYNYETEQYLWLSGKWMEPQPHWIYVPPQNIWREKGYVQIPAFWDWTLETRGLAYSAVNIRSEDRASYEHKPNDSLPHLAIIEELFPFWPNYYCLFDYSYFFHNEAWKSWNSAPSWWQWSNWWPCAWQETWWLWWWWTHPGYSNPSWLTSDAASQMAPPTESLKQLMAAIEPPPNVTVNGVVGDKKMLVAIKNFSGRNSPILPSDPKQVLQIQQMAAPKAKTPPFLMPGGQAKPTQIPERNASGAKETNVPQTVTLPPLPETSKNEDSSQGKEVAVRDFPYPQSYSKVTPPKDNLLAPEVPRAKPPYMRHHHSAERIIPQPQDAYRHPPHPYLNGAPIIHHDRYYQTRPPPPPNLYMRRPMSPMQTEHHDAYMSLPRPKVNPRSPNAHQLPGDYSTLKRE